MHTPYAVKKVDLPVVLILIPILLIGIILALFSVNVPLLDQWEMVPIIEHLQAGHFVWTDFWWQHNEHRILIPNLLLTGSALLTHWNAIVEIFIGFATAIFSFLLLLKMLGTSAAALQTKLPWWLPASLSFIWFSPVQMENWLWGWQLEWFLNVLGAVLVAYAITQAKKDISRTGLLLIICGAVLAQYSLGNGTLLWLLAVAALLYLRMPYIKVILVAASGFITTLLYYWHYIEPTYPSKTLFIHQPIDFARYVLVYLGRPLTFLHTGAVVMGLAVLAVFIAASSYLFKQNKNAFCKLLPWIGLGLYAIATACITAISRLGLGQSEAYSSRYTTISMLLPISLVVLLTFLAKDIRKALNKNYKKIIIAGLVGFGLLIITNAAWGIHSASTHRKELLSISACTHLESPSVQCLSSTYPNPDIVRQRLVYLKQIHWGGY